MLYYQLFIVVILNYFALNLLFLFFRIYDCSIAANFFQFLPDKIQGKDFLRAFKNNEKFQLMLKNFGFSFGVIIRKCGIMLGKFCTSLEIGKIIEV